jgi:hypothetical protein
MQRIDELQRAAADIYSRYDGQPWFITCGVSLSPDAKCTCGCVERGAVIVYTDERHDMPKGMSAMEAEFKDIGGCPVHWDATNSVAPQSDNLQHPDEWGGPLVLQQYVELGGIEIGRGGYRSRFCWVDVPEQVPDAAAAEDAARSLARDASRWNPSQPEITRLVRVVKPEYSVARGAVNEPTDVYYERTRYCGKAWSSGR